MIVWLTLSQIFSISVYYVSENAKYGLLNKEQHWWVFIHHSLMNLADLLWVKVAEVHLSTMSRKEQEHSYDKKMLVEEELIKANLNFSAELDAKQLKVKKNDELMLMTSKAHSALLWATLICAAVSAFNNVQDDLQELMRGYLNKSISLLKLEYQPWKIGLNRI